MACASHSSSGGRSPLVWTVRRSIPTSIVSQEPVSFVCTRTSPTSSRFARIVCELSNSIASPVRRIPARFGFDPRADVQVLAPMRRGRLGTINLNAELQSEVNLVGDKLKLTEDQLSTARKQVTASRADYNKKLTDVQTTLATKANQTDVTALGTKRALIAG